MPVYRFRVTFEDHEDLVRDIEIKPSQTLRDLQKAILASIRFNPDIEGQFFTCNDHWRKEETFSNDKFAGKKMVTLVEDPHQKLILEFDTDRPWTLYLELFKIVPDQQDVEYPRVAKEVGAPPPQFRIQPADPDTLEEDEDEISHAEKASATSFYRDPDDFEATSISDDETPEGEEGEDEEEADEFNFNDGEEDYENRFGEEDY